MEEEGLLVPESCLSLADSECEVSDAQRAQQTHGYASLSV